MNALKNRDDLLVNNSAKRLAVSSERLAAMLDCGRGTAVKIGTEAGARIKIGKKVLFDISKVQAYLNQISGK